MIDINLNNYPWISTNLNNIGILDYLLDEDYNFWVVNSITKSQKILGFVAYSVDPLGTRYNNLTNLTYTKYKSTNLKIVDKKILYVFKPNVFYLQNKNNLPHLWKEFANQIELCGIESNNIGIFGSYLIGFDIIKDVDFVVYGKQNLKKIYNNIKTIKQTLNATSISPKHIEYQYNKHKDSYSPNCDLKLIISRNWSGVQVKDGVLSTIRFIDSNHITIPDKNNNKQKLNITVIDGLESALIPRQCKVKANNTTYTLFSPLWKFQSFAKANDTMEIFGYVDHLNKTILICDKEDYIKFLNK
jgi:predicted nucleotidyltransferase